MLKDIEFRKVEQFVIGIIPRAETPPSKLAPEIDLWDCYVVNLYEKPLKNVLISSYGYGTINEEKRKTSHLRHFFERIEPKQAALLEPIPTNLFDLTNQFWVSFTLNNHIYDKKYVFVKGSIDRNYFTKIPILDKLGVMIQ